jgi:hypothetical protein
MHAPHILLTAAFGQMRIAAMIEKQVLAAVFRYFFLFLNILRNHTGVVFDILSPGFPAEFSTHSVSK